MAVAHFRFLAGATVLLAAPPLWSQAAPTAAEQIALAVQAAPRDMRDAATVMGYNSAGELVSLRAGTNAMICLADDPKDQDFHVSCYHRSLEPFMARGRAIRARTGGATREQVDSIRLREIRAGRYRVPDRAMLYQIFAQRDSVDATNARILGHARLDIVYLPNATTASTGLPTQPTRGIPWLMYPGTPWAHIMIGP